MEGEQISSVAQISLGYSVNPATANKAVAVLQDAGLLEKRRGLGMFVVVGARDSIIKNKRRGFKKNFVIPILKEAVSLNIALEELQEILAEVSSDINCKDKKLNVGEGVNDE